MFFHTWTFALFFAVFYVVYLLLKNTRLRIPWLLAASYVFYGWANPAYLLLILYATTVDYLVVFAMSRSQHRGRWLAVSIVNNLGLLCYFKYTAFLLDSANGLFDFCGLAYRFSVPSIVLPFAISFFVFQSLSYTIDCYRGQVSREPNFLRYATFIAFFPKLMMGPIDRASNLLPQLEHGSRISAEDVSDGLSLFVVGLFKKLAMADCLSLYVDRVYGDPGSYQASALVVATIAYAWQIYFDFSGYTDMARGLARLMGIRLLLNFENPYLATGLGDFWRRWHISLSTWFKDYLYIPLGGNRHGEFRTYVNMCLTMVVSGLWHGAMWTFVIWGAIHALGRVITREFERREFYRERVPTLVKQLGTFAIVSFAWIFFRARGLGDAVLIVKRIFSGAWSDPRCPLVLIALVAMVWVYQYAYESRARRLLELGLVRMGLVVLMILYLAMFASSQGQGFIYLQF
jgi:alginate O-acetyltransferase complex protein AlgI